MKKSFLTTSLVLGLLIAMMASSAMASLKGLKPVGDVVRDWNNIGCQSISEYQCVDDTSFPPDTTDYLETRFQNLDEAFELADTGLPPANTTINYVKLAYYASWSNSLHYQFEPYLLINGNQYYGGLITLGSGWTWGYSYVFTTNPATGNPWTVQEVDALQAGMSTDGLAVNPGAKIAYMQATIDYALGS